MLLRLKSAHARYTRDTLEASAAGKCEFCMMVLKATKAVDQVTGKIAVEIYIEGQVMNGETMSMSMTYNDGETSRYEIYLESHHGKHLPFVCR
jgi:hypothetical protein